MNYKIINTVDPSGEEVQYLLADDTWIVPMTEKNPMYQAYLASLEEDQAQTAII
jgi:hypothetical protein